MSLYKIVVRRPLNYSVVQIHEVYVGYLATKITEILAENPDYIITATRLK